MGLVNAAFKQRGMLLSSATKKNTFHGNYEHMSTCLILQMSTFLCLCSKIQVSRYHLPSLKHQNRKECVHSITELGIQKLIETSSNTYMLLCNACFLWYYVMMLLRVYVHLYRG